MKATVSFALTLVAVLSLLRAGASVYVFSGNPYSKGPLSPDSIPIHKNSRNGPPLSADVYYPRQSGEYSVVLFAGGLYAFAPSEAYSDVLSGLASHGFVVIGVDIIQLSESLRQVDDDVIVGPATWFEELDWMRNNLNMKYLSQRNVTVNWNHLGFNCHSAGCDLGIEMLRTNSTRAAFKGSVWYEPFSFHIPSIVNGTNWPSLVYGTQLSEELPPCCIPGVDFHAMYKRLACPRILTNAMGFGHCDILDNTFWTACHNAHFCKTDASNDRSTYKQYAQGIASSFFVATLQGNHQALQYATNRSLIPIQLGDLDYDINCM